MLNLKMCSDAVYLSSKCITLKDIGEKTVIATSLINR